MLYLPTLPAQDAYRLQHRCGVFELMLAQERDGVCLAAVGKHLTVTAVKLGVDVVKIGHGQLGVALGADIPHDLHDLAVLLIHDDGAALFYDARLLKGDLLKRAAQNGGVVKADVCNDAAVGAGDDICCIEPAAHADLEHDNVALSSAKPHKCHGGHHLKLSRVIVHCVGVRFHLRNELGDLVILNGLAVYLHTLVKAIYIRRGVKPHGEPCLFENRCQHCRDAALAVCSGDMHISKLGLRVSQTAQKLRYPFKPRLRSAPRNAVYIFKCLFVIHCFSPNA